MRVDIGLLDLMYMKDEITKGQYIGISVGIAIGFFALVVIIALISNGRR